MGNSTNERAARNGTASARGRKTKASSNGFVFSNFYPTKQQKAEIRELLSNHTAMLSAVAELAEKGLVVAIKEDIDRACFCLTLKENVPFGEPCKCMAFWHNSTDVLFAQVAYWYPRFYAAWAEDDRGLAEQQQFDW